jgi:AcrR family transcriptional regulator
MFSCGKLHPVTTVRPKLGRPVDADGDVTRTRVLSAARTAFAELGYMSTTYRLLAERTGLAPSALYNYFESKVELYAAAHNEVQVETYAEWLLPAITGTTTFAERIDALLTSFVAMNEQDPEAARFQAAARIDTGRHPELAAVRDGLPKQRRNLFVDAVDLGISTGEIPAASRESVLAMLETMTLGLIEISAQPEAHRTAVDGLRRAIAAVVAAEGQHL